MFAYGPADATAIPKPHHLWTHLDPDWLYLTQVVQGVVMLVLVVVVAVVLVL